MVKAPTKHGLDRKFKPWRKGKSQKANKRSSLKQQLRGHQRLLAKLPKEESERRKELELKIQTLQGEIEQKQQTLSEKKNAEKAHGQRFLDRQRLTRKEKKVKKLKLGSKKLQQELLKIALDQVYVAHHPNDIKYMPLFQKGERVVDQSRQLYRRAVTRRRILKEIATSKKSVQWVSRSSYEMLPKEWTIQDEERVFGGSISRQGLKNKKGIQTDDSRFSMATEHEALLKAAENIETKLDAEEKESKSSDDDDDDSDSSSDEEDSKAEAKTGKRPDNSDDSSDSDEADPLKKKQTNQTKVAIDQNKSSSSSSSSSDSSDDDDDDDEDDNQAKNLQKKVNNDDSSSDDSSSSSSSSSDSDSSDDDEDNKGSPKVPATTKPEPVVESEDEDDDFLVDADDNGNVFKESATELPAFDDFRGDKSKGWQTQRQRPGQNKRRRVRR